MTWKLNPSNFSSACFCLVLFALVIASQIIYNVRDVDDGASGTCFQCFCIIIIMLGCPNSQFDVVRRVSFRIFRIKLTRKGKPLTQIRIQNWKLQL